MKIIFLHTSKSHVNRFEKIVKSIDHSIETEHHVKEELLSHAQKHGQIDRKGFKVVVASIQKNKKEFVICTCSTYGDLCNEEENVYRIDQPIGEYIVAKFSKIGIAYTVRSTKKTSKELIEKLAIKTQNPIQIIEINCMPCWEWFQKGDLHKYEIEIANQIKKSVNNCEVIFLAQASMEGAKKYLSKEKYEVVSSPKYGVETYLELLKGSSLR